MSVYQNIIDTFINFGSFTVPLIIDRYCLLKIGHDKFQVHDRFCNLLYRHLHSIRTVSVLFIVAKEFLLFFIIQSCGAGIFGYGVAHGLGDIVIEMRKADTAVFGKGKNGIPYAAVDFGDKARFGKVVQ